MKQMLTTKSLDAMPPATAKRYEVRDRKVNGLHVRVSTTGAKVFYTMARPNGSRRRIKIGPYPVISLADARRKAMEIARDVELGEFDKTPEVSEASTDTLGSMIPKFIELHAKPNTKDWKRTESVLHKFDGLKDRSIDQIKRQDVSKVLDGIIANGTPTRANRALSAMKKLMDWCVMRGDIETPPVALLRPPTREIPRDRVLSNDEIRAIWQHSDAENYPFGPFLKLLMMTGQRRAEVSDMRWSELNLDEGIWELPASRVKNARVHIVPLPPQAVDILRSMHRFLESDFVFTTTGRSAISGFGRLKERIEATLPESTPDWRFHGFRRTASTGMAKIGVAPHVIDAVYQGGGSMDVIGAARSAFLVCEHPNDSSTKLIVHIKHNIAVRGQTQSYEIVGEDGGWATLNWLGPSDITIDDLISSDGPPRMSALDEATQFLRVFLKNGPERSTKVEQEAAARDIAPKTLERARRSLGVRSKKKGNSWFLSLPDEE